jgi:hypothetical protein
MKDYEVYNEDKSLKAVVIGRVLCKYVRPSNGYKNPEIVRVGRPIIKRSHQEAKQAAMEFCGLVTKH